MKIIIIDSKPSTQVELMTNINNREVALESKYVNTAPWWTTYI